ncbi:MAG: polysaccharide biosynthesis protein [Oscillospiraceae bacterium]|nr:polysaccharide biosynthesis protein [Oscillospiraceae bacterium]
MVVKVIGMFYKIPLVHIIGTAGNADFNNAYNVYAVLLTISTAGLPVAVSKMVSEANVLGRQKQVHKVFRVSLTAFLTLGLISFLIMYFGSEQLAGLMNDSKAALGIKALAPAVVCVGCLSAFRGYAQGHADMTPTAVSQIIEALSKLFIGLGLAMYLVKMGQDSEVAAAGAITGVTIGTMLALLYMALDFLRKRAGEPAGTSTKTQDTGKIVRELLRVAVPITISSSMVGIITVIDSSLVQGQLQHALKMTEDASRNLYGNYSTALTIYNLPASLMAAITASVIPAITAKRTQQDRLGASRIATSSLRVSALLSFPMGVGLFVLGEPIIRLLFGNSDIDFAISGSLLSTLGIASIFVCIVLVCNSVLQAYGFVNLPVFVMLIGGVVKILVNYNVVAIPSINIHGAPLGNVFCFGLVCVLDLMLISRVIPGRPNYSEVFLKPAIAALIMGGAAWGVYGLGSKVLMGMEQFQTVNEELNLVELSRTGNGLATLAAIAVAGVIYLILVLALRILSKEDLALMPKGEKIGKILHIR